MELKVVSVLLCQVNVYLPACGMVDDGVCFDEFLLYKIIFKYGSSYSVIIDGDFNSSLQRDTVLLRDRVFKEFVSERGLDVEGDYRCGTLSSMPITKPRPKSNTFWWQCRLSVPCHKRSRFTTCII